MLKAMVDVDKVSADKSPSPELFEMIQAAASSLTGFAQLWESIRKKGTHEGFTETELQDLIKPLLKQQLHMSKEQIWYMFNKEKKALTNKEAYQSRRINTPIVEKKDIEQPSNPVEEPEQEEDNEPGELKEKGVFDPEDTEEEPTELELAKIEIAQLKDALHKTQQFKPASDVNLNLSDPKGLIEKAVLTDETVFEWLRKRDNGVHTFFFDAYGVGLFQTRIMSQLKNSGVKTFKRLYFEV
jgi:hypothetical protein